MQKLVCLLRKFWIAVDISLCVGIIYGCAASATACSQYVRGGFYYSCVRWLTMNVDRAIVEGILAVSLLYLSYRVLVRVGRRRVVLLLSIALVLGAWHYWRTIMDAFRHSGELLVVAKSLVIAAFGGSIPEVMAAACVLILGLIVLRKARKLGRSSRHTNRNRWDSGIGTRVILGGSAVPRRGKPIFAVSVVLLVVANLATGVLWMQRTREVAENPI